MRSLVAFVLLLVGALMVPVATVGWWMRDTVVPTSAYVDTVAPLASDPEVQSAVENRIVAEVMQEIQSGGLLDKAGTALQAGGLPPDVAAQLQGASGALEPVVQGLVVRAVHVVVESPEFAKAWRTANRSAHKQLVAVLSGDGSAVAREARGQVEIRLVSLSAAIEKALVDAGVPFASAIPPVRGTYTIGDVSDLQRAQVAYTVLDRWGRLLPFAAAALLLAGIVIARRRRRAVIGAALLSLLGLGLLAVGLVGGREVYLGSVPAELPRPAAKAYFDVLTSDLRRDLLWLAIGTALVLVLAAVVRPRRRTT